ncbi:MAG: helix-turn-helix domain-containing protein [Flavisolibacter sp.]
MQTDNVITNLLTREQAAVMLGASIMTVYNLQSSGLLNPVKIGGRIRFNKDEVQSILNGKTNSKEPQSTSK